MGLGQRSIRRVLSYCASAEGLLSADRAFDLAVAQIVLPRLRASAPGFRKLLEELTEQLPVERYPRSAGILKLLLDAGGAYDLFQLI
jgi:hypothetical protein